MTQPTRTVLFVCLGNICRSPLAEGVFRHLAAARGVPDKFHADSAGTGAWHAGDGADPRTIAVAARHGITFDHVARQVDPADDPRRFELILAMDRSNVANLVSMGFPRHRVELLRTYDPSLAHRAGEHHEVPDPYTGGPDQFENVFHMVHRACEGLLDALLAPPGVRPAGPGRAPTGLTTGGAG